MGFMTEVSILNDRWEEIRKDPKGFVESLYESCITNGRSPSWILGQTTVAKTHHADDIRVYFAGRNSFFDLYPKNDMSKESLERHLKYFKEIKVYLKVCEEATKAAITEGESIENQ